MSNNVEKIETVNGDAQSSKLRRNRQKLLINELLLDYVKNSTLHGLRYIAEKGLSLIEKLFWITTFLISIALCSYLIKNVYVKWKNSPVIVTVNERFVSPGEVPFPSVTICPQTKSRATVYNVTERRKYFETYESKNATYEEKELFADVAIICDLIGVYYGGPRNRTNSNMIRHIEYVAPGTSDVFTACRWRGERVRCNDLFKKVYTSDGLCFNMNALAAEEMFRDTVQTDYKYSERDQLTKGWSFSNGYINGYTKNEYFPYQGSENNALSDLLVVLISNDKDNDGSCNRLKSGFKIYVQHPADVPQSSIHYYAANNGQTSALAVSFNLIGTSDTLENYSAEERQCYSPNDRELRYFKTYTLQNCRAECLSNYTFAMCNCVGFYMPHNNSSEICSDNKIACMPDAHDYMANNELSLELAKSKDGCRCLPACNSIEYEAEVLKTEYHFERIRKLDSIKVSSIEMYFKKPRFVSMKRSELFGLTDFVANIGGLLGVFLGFSFLSLIEIFYFITLRLCCTLKRDFREEKKSKEETKVENK